MEAYLYSAQHLYHDASAILLEADMRFYLRQYDKAKPLYDYLHTTFPDRLGPQIKLAIIELHEGQKAAAARRANEVINMHPRISNPAHQSYKMIAKDILLN